MFNVQPSKKLHTRMDMDALVRGCVRVGPRGRYGKNQFGLVQVLLVRGGRIPVFVRVSELRRPPDLERVLDRLGVSGIEIGACKIEVEKKGFAFTWDATSRYVCSTFTSSHFADWEATEPVNSSPISESLFFSN